MYEKFYNNANLLFDVIWDYPNSKIIQITDGEIDLKNELEAFCKEKNFSFTNNEATSEFLSGHKYYSGSAQNDYIFLCLDLFKLENAVYVLERCYASIKNSGGFLLIYPKNDNYYECENMLQNANFVAISQIELDDEVEVIYAKKMHGWGGSR